MSDALNQNPFAPPRAAVQDPVAAGASEVVDATRLQRFLAVLVDMGVSFVFALVIVAIVAATVGLGSLGRGDLGAAFAGVMGIVALVMLGALAWGVYNLVLVYRYGQVFGKRVMGIRVVRTDGSRASLARIIFARWGILWVIAMVVSIPLGLMKLNPVWLDALYLVDVLLIFRASRLCLHDHLGDTRVVTAASSEHATLAGLAAAAHA